MFLKYGCVRIAFYIQLYKSGLSMNFAMLSICTLVLSGGFTAHYSTRVSSLLLIGNVHGFILNIEFFI